MISEKLNQSLKIGIFILIAISSFLIFPEIGYGCTVKKNLQCGTIFGPSGPLYECGFNREGDGSWVCGIKMTPDSYYCSHAFSGDSIGECQNDDVWFKQDACPKTASHNGEVCIFADGAVNCLGATHCWGKTGRWDAFEKQCIECSGETQLKRFADTSQMCYNLTETGAFPISNLQWEELACATIAQTCESACGADPACDEADPGIGVAVPGGVCNNCVFSAVCSWQNDACGQSPCDAYDRHQTCGPTGCSGGTCAPGNTRCVDDPACHPCEETCTCTCPKDSEGKEICPCTLGTCPPELRGGLVPCGKNCDDPCTKACECCPCTLCHLFVLFKRIVDFATLNILFPLAVLMIVVGGVMFLTAAGDPGRIGTAKKILTSVVIGLFIIFLAWLIVDTVITFLTPAGSPFQNWSTINCPVCGDGNCDSGETSENCPADCGAPPPPPPPPPAECPNGTCNVAGGECTTCPADCNVAACCGNGLCDVAVGETNGNCPADCPLPGCPPCIICP